MKQSIKEQCAGRDGSLKSVSICVSDGAGKVLWRGELRTSLRLLRKLLHAVLRTFGRKVGQVARGRFEQRVRRLLDQQ